MHLPAVFADSSIRTRLSVLIVLNTSLALLLAGITLFGYENYEQRQAAVRELSAQARILAESSTAPLSFNDERAAGQTLAALRGETQIVEGVIYDRKGLPFAHYQQYAAPSISSLPAFRQLGAYFDHGTLLVFQPINLNSERIGTILLTSTNDVNKRLRRYIAILFIVMLLSLGAALSLSAGTQKNLSSPITELSKIAHYVSLDKDYAVRAVRRTGGEIGILIDSFNDMLSQIEIRDAARKQAEASLRESEERYALAARGTNDGLWDWNLATGKVYFSSRWNQMLGYPDHDRWLDPEEWFSLIHVSDRDRVRSEIASHWDGGTSEFASEYRISHKDGRFIWVLSRGIAVKNDKGTAIRMAGSQTDITEGKVADPLTALPNRLYFLDRLESLIGAARQNNNLFAVLFLDLDRFKLINDSLGHAAGDQLLMGIAARLRSSVRAARDHQQSVVARLGGDEFAVLLDDVKNVEDARMIAQRILDTLQSPFNVQGHQVFANVSIGIALSSSGTTPEDLLRNADTAMYYAKANGKGRFAAFDEGMRERAVARLEIETTLRKAIDTQQLILHYQPELSIRTRRIKGYEALVRWNHPEMGIRSPTEFIPIAEESDLILHLGRWVLKEACRQMVEWQQKFDFDPPLTISVNISARHLNDAGLVRDVERVLSQTGLDPRCLKLEMTEGSIMQNPETSLDTLRRLKLMGIGLEIDDFGTGYSSLSYLQRLPFDTVKIDRSFIKELGIGVESSEIVKTIIDLARSLDLKVVAEGVETEDQLQMLSSLGCNYAQGYYFAKPTSSQVTQVCMLERDQMQRDFGRLSREPAVEPSLRVLQAQPL